MKFEGPIIPMGAEISYKPRAPDDIKRLSKFGTKVLQGVFLGYHQRAGGAWTGDLLFADWSQIEEAENARDIHVKRQSAKEVFAVSHCVFALLVAMESAWEMR